MIRELLEEGNLVDIVATFVALGIIIASFLCLIYIIWGGISFILSAGNEEKIKKAVQTIRFSVIGLIVTIIAFFAVNIIARLLEIPFNLTFGTIIDLMSQILDAFQ